MTLHIFHVLSIGCGNEPGKVLRSLVSGGTILIIDQLLLLCSRCDKPGFLQTSPFPLSDGLLDHVLIDYLVLHGFISSLQRFGLLNGRLNLDWHIIFSMSSCYPLRKRGVHGWFLICLVGL